MSNIFHDAIAAHTQWKMILKKHVEENKAQDVKHIGDGYACDLGQWIYHEGTQYNRLPSFEAMCAAHEQFHRVAAEVVLNKNTKKFDEARALMLPDGAFFQVWQQLLKTLVYCSKDLSEAVCVRIKNGRKVKNMLQDQHNNALARIDGSAFVIDAINMMVEHEVGALAVVKTNDDFLGVVTERHYLKNFLTQGVSILDAPITSMLNKKRIQVNLNDSVERCMLLMSTVHVQALPVVEKGKLIGMIGIEDVVREVRMDSHEKIFQHDSDVHGHCGARM